MRTVSVGAKHLLDIIHSVCDQYDSSAVVSSSILLGKVEKRLRIAADLDWEVFFWGTQILDSD